MKRVYRYDSTLKKVVEITDGPGASEAPAGHVRKYEEIVAYTQPNLKMVKEQGLTPAPRYDKKGRPVFTSRREISDYVARANDNPNSRHQINWGDD